ncbi:MAG: hypothetical protein HKN87_14265 [Saprospiraceae bacterium]|nr:hypothetical protein [Saprospiraceae bacterium]
MPKLFASKISNLTDARFFAAYMPDYMSMPLPNNDSEEIQRCTAIKNWIEGISWVAELNHAIDESTAAILEQLGIDVVLFGGRQIPFSLPNHLSGLLSISQSEFYSTIQKDLSPFDQLILPSGCSVDRIKEVLQKFDGPIWSTVESERDWEEILPFLDIIEGIVVHGGEEDKVGLKSFEDKSELLDRILGDIN